MAPQQHLDRLSSIDASFAAPGGTRVAHAYRRRAPVRGPCRPPFEDYLDHVRSRGCTWCRATDRSSRRRRWRPGARCGSTIRASTSSTTCATPRSRLRAVRSSCSCSPRGSRHSSWIAPSRCGRTGWSRAWPTGDSRSSSRPTTRSSTASRAWILGTVLFDLERDPAPPDGRPRAAGSAAARAVERRAGRRRRPRNGDDDRRARDQGHRCRDPAGVDARRAARRRRGPRRARLGRAQPGPRDAAQRADRAPPQIRGRPLPAIGVQGGQERARRHRQRRRADRRLRRAARTWLQLARRSGLRGPRDARAGADLGPHQDQRNKARQPARW